MDSNRWERIQELFHAAADLPESEQRAFLKAACGDDGELMAEVLAVLEEDARGASLLDRDVAHVANQVMGEAGLPSLPFPVFGPYRMRGVLGEGGMGIVYLAEREDLGSLVAIKILRDAWLSPARRERFASEQRMLAQLNHPSVARLYDADTLADGTPYFVMEYVEGAPLTDHCRQCECSIQERLKLFRLVCEAVEYAHQHAMIHRDLKPSNILVKPDGGVRLLDFGIAKQLDSLDVPADRTQTGLRLMTPAYAAPEQIRGENVGIQTDVYSLGVILYELLAGRLPFDLSNLTPGEAETMIVEQEPERPSAMAQRMSQRPGARQRAAWANKASWADLDVLCLTAMHKDPRRRYRSVEALIRDIDHYLRGEPLEARPDTVSYRLGKFVRRNRRAVSAAAMVVTAVISLVVFFTVRLAIARNEAVAEATRTQRIQQFMQNLFEGGDKEAGPADNLRVVTLIDRGVQEARTLDSEPRVQAELCQTLGSIYQKLGKLDQADSLLRAALDKRRSLLGPENPEVAESLVALGLLRVDQAKLEEAEKLVREGLAMSRRTLPPNDAGIGNATDALGRVLTGRGVYDQAVPVLEEAVRLRSAPGVAPSDLAASLYQLASTHFYAGHYAVSESLNQRAVAIHRQVYGERHPLVADDLINLGAIQSELGNYQEAERFDRQALGIAQAWYGKDHPETASDMTILGRVLVYQNRFDEGVELLAHALAIQERVYGKVHPRVASALNDLGNAAVKRGKYDEAEARFRRMADIYRAVYGDHHYLLGVALSNLANVYLHRGQYGQAEQLFRDVIRRFTGALSASHTYTAIARIKLGRTLLRERRYADAEIESRGGYEILAKQANPQVSWLKNAREDLVADYDALKQPEKAGKFRTEQAATMATK